MFIYMFFSLYIYIYICIYTHQLFHMMNTRLPYVLFTRDLQDKNNLLRNRWNWRTGRTSLTGRAPGRRSEMVTVMAMAITLW